MNESSQNNQDSQGGGIIPPEIASAVLDYLERVGRGEEVYFAPVIISIPHNFTPEQVAYFNSPEYKKRHEEFWYPTLPSGEQLT